MKKYGLIGYPLAHSFSPSFFAEKFYKDDIRDADYQAYPLENINEFKDLLKADNQLIGLNVTIPYKETIIPFLDEIDEVAAAVGAVNTISINPKNRRTKGFNTDVYGFEISLQKALKKQGLNPQKALILGTGGAAKAIDYVLKKNDIETRFVSRNPKNKELTYTDLTQQIIENHTLIINTTPLGTAPNTNAFPDIPYNYLTSKHFLYDLIYNPAKTIFLIKGNLKGTGIKNGLEMLYLQAEKSWEIWENNT